MARAKKPVNDGMMQVDIDSFVRTRDSLVTGLATLTDAIQTLSSVYIKHTNAILGDHGSGLDVESALGKLADNPLFQSGGELNRPATLPVAKSTVAESSTAAAAGGKAERKKRLHDPNAPKRPLTPFFLFMQTARSVITKDFGENPAKGAISAEGTRRWQEMPPKDKILWTKVYKENLRLYNAKMHAYKGGNLLAKDMDDEAALVYADEHGIPAPAETPDEQIAGESAAAALPEEDAEGEAEPEPEPEQEPTPPPKTPKTKAGGRKSKAAAKSTPVASTPAAEPEAIVPPASASSSSIVPPAKEDSPEKKKSPEKKRKRVSKKAAAEEATEEAENEETVETPKSAPKPRKKKAKASDA